MTWGGVTGTPYTGMILSERVGALLKVLPLGTVQVEWTVGSARGPTHGTAQLGDRSSGVGSAPWPLPRGYALGSWRENGGRLWMRQVQR
jgi:hypothetical protein